MAIAEGRQRHDWDLQSVLISMVAAACGDDDAKPAKFNPFEQGEDAPQVISMGEARALFRSGL